MTAYELYLMLHLVGVVAWVGAAFLMALLGARASLGADSTRRVAFAADAEWLGLRLYLPSNALVLASGVLLVEEAGWGYGPLWIKLGLAGFGASLAMGAAFFGPGWARVGRIADRDGAGSDEVRAAVRRLLLGSWVDLGLLLAIVFVMTVKPTGGEAGALAATAAIGLAFSLLGVVLARAEGRHAARAPLAAGPP